MRNMFTKDVVVVLVVGFGVAGSVMLGCSSGSKSSDAGSSGDTGPSSGGRGEGGRGGDAAHGGEDGGLATGGTGTAIGSGGSGDSSYDGGPSATGGRTTGTGGIGGTGGRGNTGGAGGGFATGGESAGVLVSSAIPGQNPATVTKAGPPIGTVGPAFIKPLFDGNVMATDPSGNIIVAYLRDTVTTTITKFAPDLSMIWTATLAHFRLGTSALAVDASGNIYVGGEDQTTFAPTPAALAQYLSNGTPGWLKTLGSATGTNIVNSVAVGPDGKIFALGYSNGQLPSQPAAAAGGGFTLSFGVDGTMVAAAQTTAIKNTADHLQVDSSGNSVFMNNYTIMKLGAAFAPLWSTHYDALAGSIMPTNVAVVDDGSALFDYEQSVGILKRDSAGVAIWKRAMAVQMTTLDAVEGETWKGQFTGTPIMFITSDSIYLAGSYSNTYMNGSAPPPTTSPGYVARLDLTGTQLWFRQFLRAPNPNLPNGFVPLQPTSLALSGPNKLVVYQGGFANNGGTLFLLNTADGSGP